jgi:hypothetical protein
LYFIFLAGRLAYAWLFSIYEGYDDEGYLAISLVSYFKGRPLYSSTFTQYGPLYYLFSKAIYGICHAAVTTDSVRFTTWGHWLVSSVLCGLAVRRLTKSYLWAIIAFYLVYFHIRGLVHEPGHPQGLIALLTSALIFVITFYCERNRQIILVLAAALLACLTLTKINVGGYLCFAFALSVLMRSPAKLVRIIGIPVAALSVAVPALVTHDHLWSWAAPLATVVTLSIAAQCLVLLAGSTEHYGLKRLRDGVPVAIGFLLTSVLVIATVLIQGTSFGSLWAGIVTRPAHMAAVWYLPVYLDRLTVRAAICGLAFAIVYVLYSIWGKSTATPRILVTFGRLIWGAFVLAVAYRDVFRGRGFAPFAISFALPFAWLLVAPDFRRPRNSFPRTLLATAAVFGVLLIYPVAGSQHDFSTFLLIPAAAVSLADGLAGLNRLRELNTGKFTFSLERSRNAVELRLALWRNLRPRQLSSWPATTKALIECLLVLAFAIFGYHRISEGHEIRHTYRRLTVPTYLAGAERLHMPFDEAGLYHWLVSDIEANCDSLVTGPFYGSLHLWTGMPPLTGMNVTSWMQLLTPEEQQQIVDKLRVQTRPCVIYNASSVAWWLRFKNPVPEPPLMRYIREHFHQQSLELHGYQLQLPLAVNRAPEEFLLFRTMHFNLQPGYTILSDLGVNGNGRTVSMWFKARRQGALFGCQNLDNLTEEPTASIPIVSINSEGRLSAQYRTGNGTSLVSKVAVNDGGWHQFALARSGADQLLYLDGSLLGHVPGILQDGSGRFCEIGDAFSGNGSKERGHWMRFEGYVARAKLTFKPSTASEVTLDYQRDLHILSK